MKQNMCTNVCFCFPNREMQVRIVYLIGCATDDELTAELLRLNDELNNLFLRHQRYEKNRSSHTGVSSPSAVLGAAIGVPPTAADAATAAGGATAESPKLLDFPDSSKDDLLNSFSRLGICDERKLLLVSLFLCSVLFCFKV